MKLMRLITLILILVTSPVLASVCSLSCALHHASDTQQQVFETMPMDAEHCEHMRSAQTNHDAHNQDMDHQDKSPAKHDSCLMAGCHFSHVVTHELGKQHSVFNGPDQQPLHFSTLAHSAELPPPVKPPA